MGRAPEVRAGHQRWWYGEGYAWVVLGGALVDHLEALRLEERMKRRLLLLGDHAGGRDAEHVHREPLGGLRGPRAARVVGLRRVDEAPAICAEDGRVLLENGPLGVGQHEARLQRHKRAVEVRRGEVVREVDLVEAHAQRGELATQPGGTGLVRAHGDLHEHITTDARDVGNGAIPAVTWRLICCAPNAQQL